MPKMNKLVLVILLLMFSGMASASPKYIPVTILDSNGYSSGMCEDGIPCYGLNQSIEGIQSKNSRLSNLLYVMIIIGGFIIFLLAISIISLVKYSGDTRCIKG